MSSRLWLTAIVVFSVLLRLPALEWCIRGSTGFSSSNHEDEAAEIGSALSMGWPWQLPDDEALHKGYLYYQVAHVAFKAKTLVFGGARSIAQDFRFFRSLSLLTFAALLVLQFRIARRLNLDRSTALLSTLLLSLSYSMAFASVIFKNDVFSTLMVAVLSYVCIAYSIAPSQVKAAAVGVVVSAMLLSKYNTLAALWMPLLAIAFDFNRSGAKQVAGRLAMATICGLFFFSILGSAIALHPVEFLTGLRRMATYQTHRSFHFRGFEPQALSVWTHLIGLGMGPIFFTLGLPALVFAIWSIWKGTHRVRWIMGGGLGFFAAHYFLLARNTWLVSRYTTLFQPALCLLIAVFLVTLFRQGSLARRRLVVVFTSVLMLLQVLWFSEQMSGLYGVPANIRAARWLAQNLRSGEMVVELSPRASVPTLMPPPADLVSLEAPNPDHEPKSLNEWNQVESQLRPGDYVVINERVFRDFQRARGHDGFETYHRLYDQILSGTKYEKVEFFDRASISGLGWLQPQFPPQDLLLVDSRVWILRRLAVASGS